MTGRIIKRPPRYDHLWKEKWLWKIKLLLPVEDGLGGGGGGGGKSMSSYVSCSGSVFLNQQNKLINQEWYPTLFIKLRYLF